MTCRFTVRPVVLTVIILATTISSLAAAADYGPLHDKWTINAGAFFVTSNTIIRADGSVGGMDVGTTVDMEEVFGLSHSNDFRFDAIWRFKPRHKLYAMYFSNSRTGERTLEDEIDFDGETFPVDAEVTATFSTDILEVAYEYVFLKRENYEIGASLGVHNADLQFKLDATVTIVGQPQSGQIVKDVRADAPLPVLGFRGIWRVGGNVYVSGIAQYFYLKYGDYSGNLQNLQAIVKWQFAEHFAVGAGYDFFDLKFDVDGSDSFNGRLEADRGGALVFLTASF